jgi:hypothetical protein
MDKVQKPINPNYEINYGEEKTDVIYVESP